MAGPFDEEEIEGLQKERLPEEMSNYPLDDIMVRKDTRTVADVVNRITAGRYSMNPDFQRDFVWKPDKQSKLIESCVMRIPLPVLYVAEGEDGRITVVDGLQRLSTFQAFLTNKLKLTGLGKEHPLEGKRYKDLSVQLQERIEDTQLTLYILDKDAPEAARLDIFDRVNSGIALSRQQMRNALYNGPATRWLATMAQDPTFLSATGESLSRLTMRDREAINRFAAFEVMGWEDYNGDMDQFLAKALSMINTFDANGIKSLTNDFQGSMRRNQKLFGRHAFRKSLAECDDKAARSIINISMFDTFSVCFSRIPDDVVKKDKNSIIEEVIELLGDEEFSYAVTYSTNSTVQVRTRYTMLMEALKPWMMV
ncbi:hypothetical protein M2341_001412 [Sphingobium sp. B7D2B]|uniref:DUF262 domain-containing protein n=1 Tax=Sphingobium sp. B7D2B TaxID=2940583 RepID=UPI0022251D92|nr:DUF262 domain-containing protein [Sphingobium sp. B7D2B]MCW2365965.1 hypothetical protein [Sphingobium sp. B7D2B]